VFGVVLSGAVTFQVGDHEPVVLRPGDVFYEPARTRISRFDATGHGVEFLAWFPLGAGEAAEMTPL
jgi:quercetin dioxygenase-like cupin family protein